MSDGSPFDPDHPRWIGDLNHTTTVSVLVKASLREIGRGQHNPLAYAEAHRLAALCVNQRRSTHQNMLVNLALGLSLEGMNETNRASEAFDNALNDAYATGDLDAAVELNDQLGDTLRCRGRYEEAADVYQDGMEALQGVSGPALLTSPTALRFELGLAVSRMAIGHYDDAAQHLAIAREVARRANDPLLQGGIDLTMANIHTARGDAHAALPLYLAARDAYAALGSDATPSQQRNQGRLHAIAALGLLDVAEVYARRGLDVRRSTYVELAGSFAQQALNHVADTDEPGALYMGLIANARFKRISGRLPSAIHLLEPLLVDVERLGDPALAIQIHTAIAQDYIARGDLQHARSHFQVAYRGAHKCGIAYLGEPALHALLSST